MCGFLRHGSASPPRPGITGPSLWPRSHVLRGEIVQIVQGRGFPLGQQIIPRRASWQTRWPDPGRHWPESIPCRLTVAADRPARRATEPFLPLQVWRPRRRASRAEIYIIIAYSIIV